MGDPDVEVILHDYYNDILLSSIKESGIVMVMACRAVDLMRSLSVLALTSGFPQWDCIFYLRTMIENVSIKHVITLLRRSSAVTTAHCRLETSKQSHTCVTIQAFNWICDLINVGHAMVSPTLDVMEMLRNACGRKRALMHKRWHVEFFTDEEHFKASCVCVTQHQR